MTMIHNNKTNNSANYTDDILNTEETRMETELADIIANDPNISPDIAISLTSLAYVFEGDFQANLFLSSTALSKKYAPLSFSLKDWKGFLTNPSISKYLNSLKEEQVDVASTLALAKGEDTSAAIKAKQFIKASQAPISASYVVFMMPERPIWVNEVTDND